jgi:hypothetical protein
LFLLVSCAGPRGGDPYLSDAAHRESALRASVTNETRYGRERLAHYAEWSRLPEWDGGIAIPPQLDEAALLRLGKTAFVRYPAQLGLTCAKCHSYRGVDGPPNRDLDLGAELVAAHQGAPASAKNVALSWGKGRVDVTSADGSEPAKIPDLRAVRFERWLQWSGAVKQLDRTSLALRIETLIISARNYRERPPRAIALGLAAYVWSLADALPRTSPPPSFVAACGSCHEGDGLAGDRVDVDEVGTDATLARSLDRGTGAYRVTSLRGVGTRGALMHDASIVDLDTLLSPDRAGGHRYGLDLGRAAREEILAFLRGT